MGEKTVSLKRYCVTAYFSVSFALRFSFQLSAHFFHLQLLQTSEASVRRDWLLRSASWEGVELFYTKLHFFNSSDTQLPGDLSFHLSNMSSDVTTGESDDYLLYYRQFIYFNLTRFHLTLYPPPPPSILIIL